jgi:hypothetical protein
MKAKGKAVTCRQCGKPGRETPDDPAPGLCPACLDAALARVFFGGNGLALVLGDPDAPSKVVADLRALGVTEKALAEYGLAES